MKSVSFLLLVTLLSVDAAVAVAEAAATGVCEDKYAICKQWAANGYCKNAQTFKFMGANCCPSCKLVAALEAPPPVCVDEDSKCRDITALCKVPAISKMMAVKCCLSCTCMDVDPKEKCLAWAKEGFCTNSKYKKYLEKKCCGTCHRTVGETWSPFEGQTTPAPAPETTAAPKTEAVKLMKTTLTFDMKFEPAMENPESKEYKDTAKIIEIGVMAEKKVESAKVTALKPGSVKADVDIKTKEPPKAVEDALKKAAEENPILKSLGLKPDLKVEDPKEAKTTEQPKSTTPGPTKSTTPESTKTTTPESTKSSTPESTKTTTPEPTKSTTPESTKSTTPGSTKSTTPGPTKKTTPGSTKKTTPGPTKKTTPEPTKKTTPEPKKKNSPEPPKEAKTEPPKGTAPPAPSAKPAPRCSAKTVGGGCCHFPFLYKGAVHDKCITTDHDKPWCGMDIRARKWGECEAAACTLTTGGNCCKFPFVYKGAMHDKCITTDLGRPWCGLTADAKQWGECKPAMGKWGPWSDYTECSVTCDGGMQSRTRECVYPADLPLPKGGFKCADGQAREDVLCNMHDCPVPAPAPAQTKPEPAPVVKVPEAPAASAAKPAPAAPISPSIMKAMVAAAAAALEKLPPAPVAPVVFPVVPAAAPAPAAVAPAPAAFAAPAPPPAMPWAAAPPAGLLAAPPAGVLAAPPLPLAAAAAPPPAAAPAPVGEETTEEVGSYTMELDPDNKFDNLLAIIGKLMKIAERPARH